MKDGGAGRLDQPALLTLFGDLLGQDLLNLVGRLIVHQRAPVVSARIAPG